MKEVVLNYLIFFLVYGFLGWVVEVVYTGIIKNNFVNRGFLFSPFLPIYAFGAVFLIYSLSFFEVSIFELFIVSVIATTILEYISSLILENVFHVKWWDYSKQKYNIQGRVCLRNSLLFGLLAVFVFHVIHPSIAIFAENLPIAIKEVVVDIFLIGLIIDLYFTLRKLSKMSHRNMNSLSANESNNEINNPYLINGKYTNSRISNFGINVLLAISISIGVFTMFLINEVYGLIVTIIFFIILYGSFKAKFSKNKYNEK